MTYTKCDKILSCIHPIVLKILSSQRKFKLIVEGQVPKDGHYIFVANHFCIHDIPTAGEIIRKHTYVLVSDEDRHTIDGLALTLNGVVWINRLDKESRRKARNVLLEHLSMGHNILMYPEATWNLSPNLPVLPMNWGVIDISLSSSVPIIPLYLLFDGNACYARVGDVFRPSQDKIESINRLRDCMATYAWELMEKYATASRRTISDSFQQDSIKQRYDEYARARKNPEEVMRYESQFIFRPKDVVTVNEAFDFVEHLDIKKENAFLIKGIYEAGLT